MSVYGLIGCISHNESFKFEKLVVAHEMYENC